MTVAVVYSRALAGMHAPLVSVEVHLANGLPAFNLVGLPETEVKESRERVRAALQNAQFGFPARRITVNLAPADLPKESGRFDLPIAIGILVATGQLPGDRLHEYEFAGELALTGELRPIRGALAMTLKASGDGRAFILPAAERGRSGAGARGGRASGALAAAGLRAPCKPRGTAASDRGARGDHGDGVSRPRRSEGPAAGQARAGNCRGGTAQPVDDRPARHRNNLLLATGARVPPLP